MGLGDCRKPPMGKIYYNDIDTGRRCSDSDRRARRKPGHGGIENRICADRRKGARKREHARCQPKDLAFVRLRSDSYSDVAQMMDISRAGLCFQCFADSDRPGDYSTLDIFAGQSDLTIRSVSFRTVSTAVKNGSAFSTAIMKRCGVRFESLSSEQMEGLDHYLLNHTSGQA